MKNTDADFSERSARRVAAEAVVALLASAGLRAECVERCPEPTCPRCGGGDRRVAA